MVPPRDQKMGLIAESRCGRGVNKNQGGADLPKMEKIFSF
jgi:hypothetical protein